jgi:hypothetical protein
MHKINLGKNFDYRHIDDHYCVFGTTILGASIFLEQGMEHIYLRIPKTKINDLAVEKIIDDLNLILELNPNQYE